MAVTLEIDERSRVGERSEGGVTRVAVANVRLYVRALRGIQLSADVAEVVWVQEETATMLARLKEQVWADEQGPGAP